MSEVKFQLDSIESHLGDYPAFTFSRGIKTFTSHQARVDADMPKKAVTEAVIAFDLSDEEAEELLKEVKAAFFDWFLAHSRSDEGAFNGA